jgi:methyl coenzyme M reductase gamma subunit
MGISTNLFRNLMFKSLKEQYYDLVTNRILASKDDLTETETRIIEFGFELMEEKLEDIKILKDDIKRLSIENANLKAYNDDKDYGDEEE